jgi:hypothetical protein
MSSSDQLGSFVVFSQSESTLVDAAAWDAHAQRFFRTRLTVADAIHGDRLGSSAHGRAAADVALLVAPDGEAAGVRFVLARPRDAEDLALADAADAARTGLALLARRCPTVWLVARETDDDPLALRLAAILASVLLGPILDARTPELLGVKSARARFER